MLTKRPILLTLTCIAGYIWVTISFPGIFSPAIKKLGDFYPALFGLIIASTFISLVGVWYLKKWGVQLYILTFFAKQILLLFINDTGTMTVIGIVFSIIFIIIFLVFYKRMDENL